MSSMSKPPISNVFNQSIPKIPQNYPAHRQMLSSYVSFQPPPCTCQMCVTPCGKLEQINYPYRKNSSNSMSNMQKPPIDNVFNQTSPQTSQCYLALQMLSPHALFQPTPCTYQTYVTACRKIAQIGATGGLLDQSEIYMDLETALIRLEQEKNRCHVLSQVNTLLREQLEAATNANRILTSDIQRLTEELQKAREELDAKELAWRNEEQPHLGFDRHSHQGDEKQKKTILFDCYLNENIKLHKSEYAWKPSHKTKLEDAEENKTQELYKKVLGILNKLTPQKFETLVDQVKQLDITTEERLNGVTDLIFEKAVNEPNFNVSYANMCLQLALFKVPSSSREGQCVNFRQLLLTKCQTEFERDRSDKLKQEERMKLIEECDTKEERKQLQEDYEKDETKNRRRQLGNIRFIGELFKFGMLIEPIMHDCIRKLLRQGDTNSLECFTVLLTTTGKELDTDKKSSEIDKYFADAQEIVNKPQISSRFRFMLQDLIELRKNKWVPRRNENNPKTIEQIHKEAEQEAHGQHQILQDMPFVKQMSDEQGGRKGGSDLADRNPTYKDGWITSNKTSNGNYTLESMKLKLTKPEVENIQLGSSGKDFNSWSRGSSGSTKTPSNESNSKTYVFTNRSFASSREFNQECSSHLPPPSVKKTPSVSKECKQLLKIAKGLAHSMTNEQKAEKVEVLNSDH